MRRISRRRAFGAALTTCGVLALTGCGADRTETPSSALADMTSFARLVDSDEFADMVAQPGRVTINVHVPFEGDIAGTDLSIPFDQIDANAGRLPADRSTGLAIYCRSGPMSTIAAETLHNLGYTDVVELRGGMRAWQADGHPLIGT
ncbi:rhodanese-like domain-containing protein [Mycolicibacterium sp. YH-1]|jgi:rhodanese-related sulfurtransferase|uniref:rhodanese-like domain-containing protein n=1 Tax=Mycolicibacterium sp. YH-1 TaxID=2908837 RepID=UPI001F4BD9AC|nr:rhodanese-like domain-containing protein [Mycolicibacterium sp. YH-1]UNB52317.1 rhodanese-like domain-containing protein [Mycolicibacterium sp. YH-1]